MQTVAVARNAMATRFEVVLQGENPVALRAAAEEALDEVERLEAQLSLYRRTSEISRINARAAAGPVRVEPGLFRLLQRAQLLSRESGGAFDITVAPLMRCWGFMSGTGALPDPGDLAEARSKVGMHRVLLNEKDFTIQFAGEGVMLDLGAIGKGYALECAAEILREAGVESALLHGGTSTIHAIGAPPESECWKVAVELPDHVQSRLGLAEPTGAIAGQADPVLAVVPLKDEALSVSAVWGKSFEAGGKTYGHVIDPRTGAPAEGAVLAAVALPSATETDALSTALLTVGLEGHEQIALLRPGMRTLVAARTETAGQFKVEARGMVARAIG
ncbi:MAG: FAD:protein FMN transferase [Chloroflexi bacterium]|nr:FAD:protein FMN transferase [Chloroflexota bacterium]